VEPDTPLCLLLLDGPMEEVAFGRRAEDLKRAPAVLVVEPQRPVPALLAGRVAKRLTKRLPGVPRVVVLIGEQQRTLADALVAMHEGCELWDDIDAVDHGARPAFELNAELWDRLEERGIAQR
jgi:hypothetical protein